MNQTHKVNFDFSGRRALITGATSGLGARFAHVLAAHGAEVVVTGRRMERLDALCKVIGPAARAMSLDVTDKSSIDACVADAGAIDILVNNAGLNVQARARDVTEADYDLIMNTNLKGAFFMAQAVGNQMIARARGGQIINVASIGAFKALPGLTVYSMSKAAVAMMTQGLAREWARHEINVNALCPGFILTEINQAWFDAEGGKRQIAGFPRKRVGEAADLDRALLMLASRENRFMTGSMLTLDDGQLLA
jgi:NAD(P)-dependent dehydrogenase (short-subunit alcohol dehydrogenase family)